ncbi:hypothetical protein C1645_735629 [Glomus cerebriforme]|uniref:Uncharacterized protein n=1 Tax=Glomus cerebriforme TaxID=658196 RepID=A0A397TAA9_9GLOM|nr:hypothetical protein C1645_735629 [Glomus cerebriforme]
MDKPPNKDKLKEIEEFKKALEILKYRKSSEAAKEILNSKIIGFTREKEKFENYVYLYSATKGNFYPRREIICYAGPPGTGKTTFIKNLAEATGEKLYDPYFQTEIELAHFTFFATVNYPEDLAPLLKSKVEMHRLEDFSMEEKQKILSQKAREIEKKYQAKEGEIIPAEIILELPKHIQEAGIRQAERVLHKIEKEYL